MWGYDGMDKNRELNRIQTMNDIYLNRQHQQLQQQQQLQQLQLQQQQLKQQQQQYKREWMNT